MYIAYVKLVLCVCCAPACPAYNTLALSLLSATRRNADTSMYRNGFDQMCNLRELCHVQIEILASIFRGLKIFGCRCMYVYVFMALIITLVMCARSQGLVMPVSVRRVHVVFSTAGFNGGGKRFRKTRETTALRRGIQKDFFRM